MQQLLPLAESYTAEVRSTFADLNITGEPKLIVVPSIFPYNCCSMTRVAIIHINNHYFLISESYTTEVLET